MESFLIFAVVEGNISAVLICKFISPDFNYGIIIIIIIMVIFKCYFSGELIALS